MVLARLKAEQHYPRYYETPEDIDLQGFFFLCVKMCEKKHFAQCSAILEALQSTTAYF